MASDFAERDAVAVRPALTVSALNRAVAGVLARGFPLVRVRGEIANVTRAASGHWYFALKDESAQVRCVMFRSRNMLVDWAPRDGDDVELTATVALYEARGEYQLTVEAMQRSGQGRLYEEFLRVKARLAAEGLFDRARKRELPRIPGRVGVVTSLQAAALRDVVSTIARRAPYLTVVVYPTPVQGAGAGATIAETLRLVAQRAEVDVVLLVRGGGSIEDLWSFNEEAVARAIAASRVPVVVGVGHDSDVTIADFAADVRAPTPTAAAELVAPAAAELAAAASDCLDRLQRCFEHRLQGAGQRLDYAQRSLATPRAPLASLDQRVATLQARIASCVGRKLAASRALLGSHREALLSWRPSARVERPAALATALGQQLMRRRHLQSLRCAQLSARLSALDPTAVLARGYSITLDASGRAVSDSQTLGVGDPVRLVFARGAVDAQVTAADAAATGRVPAASTANDRIDVPASSSAKEP